MPAKRRKQMNSALKLTILFTFLYALVTQQVLANTWIRRLDEWIYERDFLLITPGKTPTMVMLVDDLGLRSITAIFLMITAIIISRRFKSWRPINLSILSLVLLNLVVGLSKLLFGRSKPSSGFDLVFTDSGLSYPSGHAANAVLTWGIMAYLIFRYSHKEPFEGLRLTWFVSIITTGVCLASLYRNTHWFSDLLGGLFIGSALLVLIIAIDRSISSNRQPS
ncbi:MAG: phosphatase PAP2 family protein [Actinobacteria bacterium]|jgi:membrane-associated phospholipid phosphatase|nr:phosphatase PAP2 family protein [Actinomycetota bacterium]MSY10742.1 phosphatase PAP2 family protein [Actinomycetota bacterium]